MGTPGRLAHYAQLAVRPPAEKEGPMPAFLFKLGTKVGRRGTPSGPPPEAFPAMEAICARMPSHHPKGGTTPKARTTPQVSAPPHVCLGASRARPPPD